MGAEKDNGTQDMTGPPVEEEMSEELEAKVKMFLRGEGANLEGLQDKKLKSQLSAREDLYGQSARAAAKAEKWLLPSEGGYLETEGIEKTWRIRQEAITREVDILSAKNQHDIILPDLGPYTLDFTASGRYMAAAGRKGHLALVDMKDLSLIREIQVRETVRDIVFLHNETFFAAAQKKYAYIYNRDGAELHCLKEHGSVLRLQFLKNNLLLASINKIGQLHYQDVSVGQMTANYRPGVANPTAMQVNPFNAVVCLGHSNGTVSMWKPTTSTPLVKMLCHKGPICDIAFHQNGHLMATSGKDRKIKLWDLRKYEVVQTIPGLASTLDFSQKGLLACGNGSCVEILGNFADPTKYSRYMSHSMVKGYQTSKVMFRPYEDVLGIGHSMGWSSILIPGSGEPNFDSWVANPFETSKQRAEKEVKSVYDKLMPETIMLDPSKIGTVQAIKRKDKKKKTKKEKEEEKEAAIEAVKNAEVKKKTKGRSKPSRKAKKRQDAIAMAKRPFMDDEEAAAAAARKKQRIGEQVVLPTALQRFARKSST